MKYSSLFLGPLIRRVIHKIRGGGLLQQGAYAGGHRVVSIQERIDHRCGLALPKISVWHREVTGQRDKLVFRERSFS